jgi:hypothetical protein
MTREMVMSKGRRQTVFSSGYGSRNDRKVILIFGLGYGHGSSHTITSCTMSRGGRTIYIVSMSHLADGQVALLDPPVLMKRCDDLDFIVNFTEQNWKGRRDQLIIYGWVAEVLGSTQMG